MDRYFPHDIPTEFTRRGMRFVSSEPMDAVPGAEEGLQGYSALRLIR